MSEKSYPPPPPPRRRSPGSSNESVWTAHITPSRSGSSWPESPPPPRRTEFDRNPNQPPKRKIGKKILAIAAGFGVLAGAGAVGVKMMGESNQPSTLETPTPMPIETTENIRDLTEVTSSPSQELIDKFSADLEGSQCDTPETPIRAAEVYHNAFEAIEFSSATLAELELATESITAKLAESRENLNFGDLPGNYSELASDIKASEPSLPIEAYQSALEEIGIDATYQWRYEDGDYRDNIPGPNEAVALPPEELIDNTVLKRAIFATINSNAMIPQEVIDMSDGIKVYFGDITDHPDAVGRAITTGFMSPDNERIIIDVSKDKDHIPTSYYGEVFSHETYHLQYNRQLLLCGEVLNQAYTKQYPEGFTPSEDAMVALSQNTSIDNRFTTLQGITVQKDHDQSLPEGLEVVAVTPYGASEINEGMAVLMGENVLGTLNTDRLFTAPEMSDTIYNQLAIGVARFDRASPEVAGFYTNVLQAAALEHEIKQRLDSTWNAQDFETYDTLELLIDDLNQAQTGLG